VTDKAIHIDTHNTASIEGIELFDQTVGHDQTETVDAVIADTDWTPEQAAKALGKSVRTIRRLLQDGTLKGYKVAGPRRDEWRVKPVTMSVSDSVNVRVNASTGAETDRLWQLLREKDAKLEALTMRTGYLEAQLENHKEQIRLLTDSQHNAGWWARFSSWFLGSR
jgi:excisionase family DNA binding protein